jgi:hypothetical protein
MKIVTIVYAMLFVCFSMDVSMVKAQQKPNVIVIYSDDQGAIDLNCYGSKDLVTPNIDR